MYFILHSKITEALPLQDMYKCYAGCKRVSKLGPEFEPAPSEGFVST